MSLKKVVVVDDDVTSRKIMAAQIEKIGAISMLASDGEQAWRIIEENYPIDLVITDYEMPNMSGGDLVDQVRKKFTAELLPIIVVSGVVKVSDIRSTLEQGVRYFVPKPLETKTFTKYVINTLHLKD